MPINPAVAGQANAQVQSFIGQTQNPQHSLLNAEPYLGRFPRFVQLPATAAAPPAGDVPPNTSGRSPGRTVGWPEIKANGYTPPALLRCELTVSEYQYPSAVIPWGARTYTPGWFVVATLVDAGVTYSRTYDGAGPGGFATGDWAEVVAP